MKLATFVAAFALAAWLPCGAVSIAAASEAVPLPRDSVYHLPVKLTDQDGKVHEWRSYRGKPQIVSMFYTSCKYICPLIVDSGKAVERSLTPNQQRQLGMLLISMDPTRDTPAALRAVADTRRLDPARWSLVSPSTGDVRAIAAVLGIRFRALADGEFNHTSMLVLLGAEGQVIARTEQVGSRPDPEFLEAVRRVTDGGP